MKRGRIPLSAALLVALAVTSTAALACVVNDYDYDRDEGAGGGAEAFVRGYSGNCDYYQRLSFGGREWYYSTSRLLNSGSRHRAGLSWAESHHWVTVQILWLPWHPVVCYDADAMISIP